MSTDAERTIPLLVGDYASLRNFNDEDSLTVLVMRVYPYKFWMVCWVPGKGRDTRVVARIARFIKDAGLTHFAYRSDREPTIAAMIDEACALSGRKGIKLTSDGEDQDVALDPDDLGELSTADVLVGNDSSDVDQLRVESTHTAKPEVSHPGESQSNEKSVGDYIGQLRTLKTALESRMKARLSCSHPVMQWLIEHTAYVLASLPLGATVRLRMVVSRGVKAENACADFGERIMWYMPTKMRSKFNQRWRYGFF